LCGKQAELNTMFNRKANKTNVAFNNALFTKPTIAAMHETAERLYQAAKELLRITGQSAVARILNASPQTLKNWESRGVSKAGMLDAERLIGCSATWIETGHGRMRLEKASYAEITASAPLGGEEPAATPWPSREVDPHIQVVVEIMQGLDPETRAVLRGRVEGWAEALRSPVRLDIDPAQGDKKTQALLDLYHKDPANLTPEAIGTLRKQLTKAAEKKPGRRNAETASRGKKTGH
jgi:DNA-binding transcriptional regulator YiaG